MAYQEQLAYLLHEIRLWREQGLIGEEIYRALWNRYARLGLAPHLPEQMDLFAGAVHSPQSELQQELEREALRIVAADPPPGPGLEQELEQEVQLHQQLEREVAQARESEILDPVEQRETSLGNVVQATIEDLACPAALTDPAESPARRVLRRDSFWSASLRPFLDQNALWLAGGLLVLFGSIYFLRLVWDDLSSLALHGVITAALLAYAGGFFGVGYMLSRRKQAHGVGRILFCFAAAILPLANLATGELVGQLVDRGVLFGLIGGGGAALAALALQSLMLAVMGGLFERSAVRPLLWGGLALGLLAITVAPLTRLLPQTAPLVLLGFVVAAVACLTLCASRVHLRSSLLFVGGTLVGSLITLVVRAHLASPQPVTHYASLIAALAALLITCDHRLRVRADLAPRLTALGLWLHGALLTSVALALSGLATLGYFDLWARINVMVSSSIALVWLALGAVRHGRGAMTHLAATAGLLTYFFLPAPFTGLLRLAQRWVNAALGYQDTPLPVAYYGLAFIPYILALTVISAWAGRRGRADLRRDLQRFVMVLSVLLVMLSVLSGGDLRPMLWSWPLYAGLAFVWSRLFSRPYLRHAGHLIAVAFVWVLGVWGGRELAPQLCAPLLLGLHGLALATAGVVVWRPTRQPQTSLVFGSLLAAGAALLALPIHGPGAWVVLVTLAGSTLALALVTPCVRSRITAHLCGLLAVATTVAGCVAWAPGEEGVALVLVLHAALASTLVHLQIRSTAGSQRWRLVAAPATVSALLSLALFFTWCIGFSVARPWASVLVAVMLVHLLLVGRSWVATGISALGAAAASCTLAALLWPDSWPVLLAVVSSVYMFTGGVFGASRVSRALGPHSRGGSPSRAQTWHRARARGLALVVSAFVLQAVALIAALDLSVSVGSMHLGWAAAAMGGLALFCLAAALVRPRPFQLVCFAAAAALGLALGLHQLVGGSTCGTWHLGALFAALGLGWALVRPLLAQCDAALRRTAGWLAFAHVLLPLSIFGAFLGVSTLLCGTDGGLLLGLVSMQLGWGAALCLALCLLAAARVSRQLSIAAGVGLILILFRLVWPTAHLSAVLGGIALLLAWIGQREVHVTWPLSLLGAALIASHGHTGQPHLTIAALAGLGTLLLAWRESRHAALQYGWQSCLVLGLQLAVVWLATVFSTGRYPPASVMALMAPVALGSGLMLAQISRTWSLAPAGQAGRVAMVAAGLLGLGAVTGCAPVVPSFVVLFVAATLSLLVVELARQGRRDERPWQIHGAGVALTLLYLILRSTTALAACGPWLDGVAVLVAGQAALWRSRGLGDLDPLRAPLHLLAVVWPLGALAVLPRMEAGGAALFALLVALHYAGMARLLWSRHLGIPAMLFANLALYAGYSIAGWSDPLLYAVPVSVTLLGLVHVYARELGHSGGNVLRGMILVGLYTLGISRALVTLDPLQTLLVVPSLCVAGIVAGTLLRVRVYVAAGVAFLAADLLVNMVRYGLASPHLGALFLTLLGLGLVGGMVVFSLERERILRRYSSILGQLRTWE